mgnify:CR=1 FL=1
MHMDEAPSTCVITSQPLEQAKGATAGVRTHTTRRDPASVPSIYTSSAPRPTSESRPASTGPSAATPPPHPSCGPTASSPPHRASYFPPPLPPHTPHPLRRPAWPLRAVSARRASRSREGAVAGCAARFRSRSPGVSRSCSTPTPTRSTGWRRTRSSSTTTSCATALWAASRTPTPRRWRRAARCARRCSKSCGRSLTSA